MIMRLSLSRKSSESGNIFLAIFGAVALVGLLGASIMTFMKGPLSTSVKLTKINTAENQMAIGSQVAVMAAANQANNGDCDSDGTIEPVEWRTATTEPIPVGGGLVPLTLGINKKDPWGTEYGYCAWNYGTIISQSGTCGANMLQGNTSNAYPVVALISAGPDKTFTTTCLDFGGADINHNGILDGSEHPLVSKAAETDDDIITSYTYEEATGVSGGLWSLKAGSPGTAVINKKIEASGVADLKGGVLLPDKAFINCNLASNAGVMAKSTAGIEICDGTGIWKTIGGGASGALSATATCASSTDAGNVRYDSVSGQPQFCNGTSWLPFSINTPGVNLVISPNNSSTLNVDGASNQDTVRCTSSNNLTCGSPQTFTITNQGTVTSATTVIQLIQSINGVNTTFSAATLTSATNTSNFVITANTCTTTLAVNATCTVTLEPKAPGNTSYAATLRVNTNNIPLATLSGSATNFGCIAGRVAPGGTYFKCGLNDGDGTYDLVAMPSGCSSSTTNPTCSGSDSYTVRWGDATDLAGLPYCWAGASGANCNNAQPAVNLISFKSIVGGSFNAAEYCDAMNYGGKTDWYLPNEVEVMQGLYPAKVSGALTGFQNGGYWTSNVWGSSGDTTTGAELIYMADGSRYNGAPRSRVDAFYVRCVRRENLPLPSPTSNLEPSAILISPNVVFNAGERTSKSFTMKGVTSAVTVSISGAGNPKIKVNGGAEVSSAAVSANQTVQFLIDAPSILATKNTAVIHWGPTKTYNWWAGYADSSKTAIGFVTSGVVPNRANMGGLSGADAICNNYAATSPYGLSGSWKAILADSTTSIYDHIPWSWGVLKTVTGNTIVDGGMSDLLDGTFDDFFNVTEQGATTTMSLWSGANEYGTSYNNSGTSAYYFAYDWTSSACCSTIATYGQAGSKSATGLNMGNAAADNGTLGIRCIEDLDTATDVTPTDIRPGYIVQATASTRQLSLPFKISGMSAGATQTMAVSAPAGTPTFKVNNGPEVTSAAIANGDSVVFLMDAPATANTSYKMTITAGPMTSYWRVWTGDLTGNVIKRIFPYNFSNSPNWGNMGGLSGGDTMCTNAATSAGLGGSWKVIMSGKTEPEWAVNRIGYNWSKLRSTSGVDIVMAGNIWKTDTTPLLAAPVRNVTNSADISTNILTNSNSQGLPVNTTDNGTCGNYTNGSDAYYTTMGSSGVVSDQWMKNGNSQTCGYQYYVPNYIYCIEQ